MLEYDRIDISEGTDINKTNLSKDCMICHFWQRLDKGFKYKPYISLQWLLWFNAKSYEF